MRLAPRKLVVFAPLDEVAVRESARPLASGVHRLTRDALVGATGLSYKVGHPAGETAGARDPKEK